MLIFIGYDNRNNRTAYAPFNGTSRGFGWTFDDANRDLTTTNGLNVPTTWTWDAAGRRETRLDGNNQLMTLQRDDVGQKTATIFSDGTRYEWGFDGRRNRTLEKSPDHERHLLFDELNRLKQVDDVTLGRTIVYGYDSNGNRASITEGGVTQRFEYDSRNLLISAREGSAPAVQLKYDALGRRTAIIRPNGVRTDFVFDEAGQVANITHSKGGVALLAFSYQHDGDGMRTRKTREDGSFEQYGYDSSRRLTSVNFSSGRAIGYGLDAWGNWWFTSDTARPAGLQTWMHNTNAFNQSTSVINFFGSQPVSNFTYDNNGNTLTETKGSSFGGGATTYTWTKGNRLASVSSPAGVTTYKYDALGVRTQRVDGSGTVNYLLDGPSVLAELDGAGAVAVRYLNNPRKLDDVFAHTMASGTYYPLTDALGSVYALTDGSGAVVRRYAYEVYGERTDLGGTGPTTDRGFTGRWHDANGLIDHRSRQRDPKSGHWLRPDIGSARNLYAYGPQAPTMGRDPSGHWLQIELGGPDFEEYGRSFLTVAYEQLHATVTGFRLWHRVAYNNAGRVDLRVNVFIREASLNLWRYPEYLERVGLVVGETRGAISWDEDCRARDTDILIQVDPRAATLGQEWRRGERSWEAHPRVGLPGGHLAHELGHAWGAIKNWDKVFYDVDFVRTSPREGVSEADELRADREITELACREQLAFYDEIFPELSWAAGPICSHWGY